MQDRAKKRIMRARQRRMWRVRRKLHGTSDRPRLTVFRSNKGIYAQLIDDDQGHTLVTASSLSPEMAKQSNDKKTKVEISKAVGQLLAQKAKEKGLMEVVFDRGLYLYHGRVKALAEGARKGGLTF
jgi:large subunit ribosomal protein L18